jgi:hypothetical protein
MVYYHRRSCGLITLIWAETEQLLLRRRQNLDNYRSIGWLVLNHLEMRQAVLAKSKEVTVGSRIFISRLFAMRMGYFHESPLKAQDNSFP